MAFILAKSFMSMMKMVVLTMFSKVIPAASSTAFMFCITCSVSASIVSKTKAPVAGLIAICPEA
jgi:hypothetical protein